MKLFGSAVVESPRSEILIEGAAGLRPVDEIPTVRDARTSLLKAMERVAAATAEAGKFRPGEMTLAAVTAAGELEAAHEALRPAEARLAEIREAERSRIIAGRLPRERELRGELLVVLEAAAERARILREYKKDSEQLIGGQRAFEGAGNFDWAGEFCDEAGRESLLSVWRRVCERDGLF